MTTLIVDVRLAAADVLTAAAELVARRGHHPGGFPAQSIPHIDFCHVYRCPLSGLSALYAVVNDERAHDIRPHIVPAEVDRAIDAWAVHLLRFYGATAALDLDGFVDPAATVTAWELTATVEQVTGSLRAAAYPLLAEGSLRADVTAKKEAAA